MPSKVFGNRCEDYGAPVDQHWEKVHLTLSCWESLLSLLVFDSQTITGVLLFVWNRKEILTVCSAIELANTEIAHYKSVAGKALNSLFKVIHSREGEILYLL